MIDVKTILSELSKERPVFHSEADFQHALAWKIREKCTDLNLRLGKGLTSSKKAIHVDIFMFKDERAIAEVKYRTKGLNVVVGDEEFYLKDHSAVDFGRYGFVFDISRLEDALEDRRGGSGTAIFLTNDNSYWMKPKIKKPSADDQFRIHEDRVLEGKLEWRKGMASWNEPITLKSRYTLSWTDYSNLGVPNSLFRYLLVEIMRRR